MTAPPAAVGSPGSAALVVEQLFPGRGLVDVTSLPGVGAPASAVRGVGEEGVLDFLDRLSRELLSPRAYRAHPELAALGTFLRRRNLRRLLDRPCPPDTTRHSLGRVLHFPPANVDTVFLYSWALSLLAGNVNVVRLSPRAGGVARAIVDALHAAAVGAEASVLEAQALITYDRNDSVTAALSDAADLRVLWGGDASVNAIRRFPVSATSRDLTFPDRTSLAVISAASWRGAVRDERLRVATAVVDDITQFEQAACSSARTLVWVGTNQEVDAARESFVDVVAEAAENRSLNSDPAMTVQRRVAGFGLAAEGLASRLDFRDSGLTSVLLEGSAGLNRRWLGSAVLVHARADSLVDVARWVTSRDQTLAHHGFTRGELEKLSSALPAAGLYRIVPLGTALQFGPVWDGYDLYSEFTRLRVLIC